MSLSSARWRANNDTHARAYLELSVSAAALAGLRHLLEGAELVGLGRIGGCATRPLSHGATSGANFLKVVNVFFFVPLVSC